MGHIEGQTDAGTNTAFKGSTVGRENAVSEVFGKPSTNTKGSETNEQRPLLDANKSDGGLTPSTNNNILDGIYDRNAKVAERITRQPNDITNIFEKLATVGAPQEKINLSKDHPSPLTSAAAFDALKRMVGVDLTKPGVWDVNQKNPEQVYFADRLPGAVERLGRLPSGIDVKGMAAKGKPDEVNKFLKDQGFDIQLKDQKDPRSLYLAGTLKVSDDWTAKAKKMTANDGKDYDSVYKTGNLFNVDGKTVAQIHENAEKGINVYAVPMPENMSGVDINKKAEEILAKIKEGAGKQANKRVEFPMVDLNESGDITGIVGMGVKDSDLYIKEAKVQSIVQMDETGFDAKQAAAFGLAKRSVAPADPKADFQVKDKFLFIVADNNNELVMAKQVGEENWKRPPKRG